MGTPVSLLLNRQLALIMNWFMQGLAFAVRCDIAEMAYTLVDETALHTKWRPIECLEVR